ncbi:extracellular solute-binding protein [Rhodobaculum claviforme]|uniref:Fe(3+) ABC transporter substrate-binding protein n=1 Tax=Rhodobaculum claviforme TaxID=1549854 RepID=A0A934TIW4_9RHOB|nr:extracellular solute-binding protein [Rhodobaculum claviforme]MBK5926605.1 Fe(3+) ABC transporter substrate-binding protein [Rhodobaculum claviforme]
MLRHATASLLALATALPALPAMADELNLFSARHYDTDLQLYDLFTEATGIRVNLIEGSGDELQARIEAEGANSPADILLTVDAGRLHRAEVAGLFQPVDSDILTARIPAELRHPDNLWFGLSSRARVIFHNADAGPPEGLSRMEDLADPRFEGEICMRSSSNIYSVSLLAELIEVLGADAAEDWARGIGRNLARAPQGGDTDQIRAVAAGECAVGISNTYYWGRLKASSNPADVAVADATAFLFPNQDDRGTHTNISGAGVLVNAPNRDNAIAFLEFLVSDTAQQILADGNNEYPVVAGVQIEGPMAAFTDFRSSGVNASVFGLNAAEAVMIWDRAGVP